MPRLVKAILLAVNITALEIKFPYLLLGGEGQIFEAKKIPRISSCAPDIGSGRIKEHIFYKKL